MDESNPPKITLVKCNGCGALVKIPGKAPKVLCPICWIEVHAPKDPPPGSQ